MAIPQRLRLAAVATWIVVSFACLPLSRRGTVTQAQEPTGVGKVILILGDRRGEYTPPGPSAPTATQMPILPEKRNVAGDEEPGLFPRFLGRDEGDVWTPSTPKADSKCGPDEAASFLPFILRDSAPAGNEPSIRATPDLSNPLRPPTNSTSSANPPPVPDNRDQETGEDAASLEAVPASATEATSRIARIGTQILPDAPAPVRGSPEGDPSAQPPIAARPAPLPPAQEAGTRYLDIALLGLTGGLSLLVTSLALVIRRLITALEQSTRIPAAHLAARASEGAGEAIGQSDRPSKPPHGARAPLAGELGFPAARGPRLWGSPVEEQHRTQQQEAEILKQAFEENLFLRERLLSLQAAP